MAPRFIGSYEHSLDTKGRVILPRRFRDSFASTAFVAKHLERCLALWTPEAFEQKLDQMEAILDRSPEERRMVRAWSAGSVEVPIDGQGRVPIPAYLREYARLESAVLVNGSITHVELWSPEEWSQSGAPGDSDLADPASLGRGPAPSAPEGT